MNLQQTPHDRLARLRIWAKLDESFKILAGKLGLGEIKPQPLQIPAGDVYKVPYNTEGKYDKSCSMVWDLRDGAPIWIAEPNASNFGVPGKILGKRPDGHYKVLLNEQGVPVVRLMGNW